MFGRVELTTIKKFNLYLSRIDAFWASVIADGSLDYFCGKDLRQVIGIKQQIFSVCNGKEFGETFCRDGFSIFK